MGKRDKRVDAYIARSAAFAQPVLRHFRKLVHEACPGAEETIKWGFPHFDYRGIMCSMAAFKQHCAFGFWKASLMADSDGLFSSAGKTAMGHLGRVQTLDDLPAVSKLKAYVREAARLNEDEIKAPRLKTPRQKKALRPPAYFMAAVGNNKKARKTFEEFSPSHKREYVEWVTEAKTEETRAKRLKTTVEWLAEGKARNWKYVRK